MRCCVGCGCLDGDRVGTPVHWMLEWFVDGGGGVGRGDVVVIVVGNASTVIVSELLLTGGLSGMWLVVVEWIMVRIMVVVTVSSL